MQDELLMEMLLALRPLLIVLVLRILSLGAIRLILGLQHEPKLLHHIWNIAHIVAFAFCMAGFLEMMLFGN